MFSPKLARDMAKQFVDSLSPSFKNINQDIEKQLHQFLQQCFNKMELVTREEFDIQSQVLAKTRAKLEQMEAKVRLLEERLNTKEP